MFPETSVFQEELKEIKIRELITIETHPFSRPFCRSSKVPDVPNSVENHQWPKASEQKNVPRKPNRYQRQNDPQKDEEQDCEKLNSLFNLFRKLKLLKTVLHFEMSAIKKKITLEKFRAKNLFD